MRGGVKGFCSGKLKRLVGFVVANFRTFLLRPPKLVNSKYTSEFQIVSRYIRGGEVLPYSDI